MSMMVVVVVGGGGGVAANHQPAASSLLLDSSSSSSTTASYFPASFLAEADLYTMRKTALISAPASEHVALEWSCLTEPANLENALFLAYSTHRAIKTLYITVPKMATEDDVAAAGFPATSLRPATRFQNLVYRSQDVHWSVVGKEIHDLRKYNLSSNSEYYTNEKTTRCLTIYLFPFTPLSVKQDDFWTKASQAYKMNRLETVKERPALPAVRIASIARTQTDMEQQETGGIILPRMSRKSMKLLQPAHVDEDLAELALPTWQPPSLPPPSLIPDFHDADHAGWS